MNTPESETRNEFPQPQLELLRSIAASLKAIHVSLENLTGAVEGVADSIEKAHEPEGDLGVHLVAALKDLSSSLHKRAQQERVPQSPQRVAAPQNFQPSRREPPAQRHEDRPRREQPAPETHLPSPPPDFHGEPRQEFKEGPQTAETFAAPSAYAEPGIQETGTAPLKPRLQKRPRRNRRGGHAEKNPSSPSHDSPQPPASME